MKTESRRQFLREATILSTTLMLPWSSNAFTSSTAKPITIGIVADVHKDIMHDANERLQTFMDRAVKRNPDFIIQMGDFCIPKPGNQTFVDIWNQFEGPRHHVLGNHDTDGGFSKDETMKFWGMPKQYYSFDAGDFHFVILDGNDKNPGEWQGYVRYINEDQQAWLRDDLARDDKPVFVFSHQSLENFEGVANQEEIRKILEEANEKAGFRKVIACFSGHHHIDYNTQINGIHYVQINSMSYQWLGGDYQKIRYSEEVDEQYPWIKYTVPYRDPLFAFMTISPKGVLKIEGVKSEFVGPSPDELGYPEQPENNRTTPYIISRKIR